MNSKLEQARTILASCQAWTNIARHIGNKEYREAQDNEWNAMLEVCRLEYEEKLPIKRILKTSTMRRM